MKLRAFNEEGIYKMKEFLLSLSSNTPLDYPEGILESKDYSDVLDLDFNDDLSKCQTRLELGKQLYEIFNGQEISDKGVWTWLSLKLFLTLCPLVKGKRKPYAMHRWIPENKYNTYYRHLLAGPYNIYKSYIKYPRKALSLLCNPPNKPGELAEQLASRQEIVTNHSITGAATKLYINPKTNKFKKGAGGSGLGSPRRLADIMNQFDLTWDLYMMDEDQIYNMLPSEFKRFKK